MWFVVVFDQIKGFQIQAIMEKRVQAKKKKQKGMQQEDPSKVSFSCRHCDKTVFSGDSIKVIENMHHVNITSQFRCESIIFCKLFTYVQDV